jgi:hypothetical protein
MQRNVSPVVAVVVIGIVVAAAVFLWLHYTGTSKPVMPATGGPGAGRGEARQGRDARAPREGRAERRGRRGRASGEAPAGAGPQAPAAEEAEESE